MLKTKYKNLLLGGLVALVLVMGIAFSVFSTNLNIEGTSNISNKWDIRITNIEAKKEKIVGHAKDDAENPASYEDLTATFSALLYYPNDSITYDITLKNSGTLDATLNNIEKNITKNSDKIAIEFSGFTKGQVLRKNSEEVVHVKVTYKNDVALAENNNNIKYLNNNESIIPTLLDTEEDNKPQSTINVKFTFTQEGESGSVTQDKYLVEYDCITNGGTDCTDYNEYLYSGDKAKLGNEGTEKKDYVFIGWSIDSNSLEPLNEYEITNEDVTLYAIYVKDFILTYEYNGATGGNSKATKEVIYNKEYGDLPTPIRSYTVTYNYNDATGGNENATAIANYTFDGWHKESTFENSVKSATIYSLIGDSTIYAKWTETSVTLPTPTKEGYTFNGWYSDSEFTNKIGDGGDTYIPTENKTLYAKWTDETGPTVTLNPNEQSNYTKDGTAVTVTIEDNGEGLEASQDVYYAWSTSNSEVPTFEDSITTTNTSGAKATTVTIPASSSANLTGTYYLWIKAGIEDKEGNASEVKTSSAFNFDNENPSLSISTTSTTSTITIVANASSESNIKAYSFIIDGSAATCKNGTDDNICIVENLAHNTTHNVGVTVTSNVDKTNTSSTTATTAKINTPTYSQTNSNGTATVRITYPSITVGGQTISNICTEDNYTCEYSTNNGSSWTPVTTITKDVSFSSNGTNNVTARIKDETNSSNIVTASTYTVTISNATPNYSCSTTYSLGSGSSMTCYSSRSNATKTCSGYQYNGTCYETRTYASSYWIDKWGNSSEHFRSEDECWGYGFDCKVVYTCTSGTNGNNGYCYSGTGGYNYSCSSGTSGNDGYCYSGASNPNVSYSCSSGTLSGTKCIS